jgi:hypothetical protein
MDVLASSLAVTRRQSDVLPDCVVARGDEKDHRSAKHFGAGPNRGFFEGRALRR